MQEIFLMFLLGLNIIDWFSLCLTIIFQAIFFSLGMNLTKKL